MRILKWAWKNERHVPCLGFVIELFNIGRAPSSHEPKRSSHLKGWRRRWSRSRSPPRLSEMLRSLSSRCAQTEVVDDGLVRDLDPAEVGCQRMPHPRIPRDSRATGTQPPILSAWRSAPSGSDTAASARRCGSVLFMVWSLRIVGRGLIGRTNNTVHTEPMRRVGQPALRREPQTLETWREQGASLPHVALCVCRSQWSRSAWIRMLAGETSTHGRSRPSCPTRDGKTSRARPNLALDNHRVTLRALRPQRRSSSSLRQRVRPSWKCVTYGDLPLPVSPCHCVIAPRSPPTAPSLPAHRRIVDATVESARVEPQRVRHAQRHPLPVSGSMARSESDPVPVAIGMSAPSPSVSWRSTQL